ncbi:MAG: hypothetical protein EOP48_17190 [Sphingobacteriales bacterium]|nr:MAG: hypothetical protein EOP48_17190 [Sphingobacteriales bacterium]
MKKAILTFGLFAMVMVLTSFTAADTGGQSMDKGKKTDSYDTGGVKLPGDKKLDVDFETGGVKLPGDKKLDYETGGVKLPGDKKLD